MPAAFAFFACIDARRGAPRCVEAIAERGWMRGLLMRKEEPLTRLGHRFARPRHPLPQGERGNAPFPSRGVSSPIQPHAGELPLRHLFHRVAHALAPDAARTDPAERIAVEAEAARIVDPHRADMQLAR